jgi:lipoprotein NlpI
MFAKASKSPWLAAGIVSAITLAVFWPVLSADFVMWDDDIIIYENLAVRGLSLEHIGKIFTDVDSMMRYNPLTLLSWSTTYQFFGLDPFWYHMVNWLLHGANAMLVFFVLRWLLLASWGAVGRWVNIAAATGALLWSLHPLRVEPVAWCTDRTYCQALFFLLLSLICYLRANAPGGAARHKRLYLAASVVLYVVSLLSYAIGMTFFIVFFVLDIYPLKRLGGESGWWRNPSARRALVEKLPFAIAGAAIALVTVCIRIASAGVWNKPVGLDKFGLLDRFMQAIYIWAYYLWRPFRPVNLSPAYTRLVEFDPLSLPFVASAVLVIVVVAVLIFLRRRWPLGLALGVCYLVLLVPVLGIFEHPHYSNDRYSLLVSVLFSVLVAALLASPRMTTWLRNAAFVISAMVIASLGTLAFRQTYVWHDSVTLFEHMISTLGNDPYAADPHYRLGSLFVKQGRTDEAISHFEQAIRIKPDYADAHYNLGFSYGALGRYQDAIESYQQAIRIKPDYADAHNNLGVAYGTLGRLQDAIETFRQAIRIKPDYADAHCNLGNAYLLSGDKGLALEEYKILKTLDAELANKLFNWINAK